jgi:hypothetical protein
MARRFTVFLYTKIIQRRSQSDKVCQIPKYGQQKQQMVIVFPNFPSTQKKCPPLLFSPAIVHETLPEIAGLGSHRVSSKILEQTGTAKTHATECQRALIERHEHNLLIAASSFGTLESIMCPLNQCRFAFNAMKLCGKILN